MIRVEYYPNPIEDFCEVEYVTHLAEFVRYRDDRQELVFYTPDLLGEEIDTSTGNFLFACDYETVTVFNRKHLPQVEYAVIAVTSFVLSLIVSKVMMPSMPSAPDVGGRDQPSATNSLGEAKNEAASVNSRIDDVFGEVAKHTPKMIQRPYRVGIDDKECEVLLCCVGRGKYQHSDNEVYDGDTRVKDIENAQVDFYRDRTRYANIGGGSVGQQIGIYREPNEHNAAELLPPNDTETSVTEWQYSTTEQTYRLRLTHLNASDAGVDYTDLYRVGDDIRIENFKFIRTVGNVIAIYRNPNLTGQLLTYRAIIDDYSGDFTIMAVGQDYFEVQRVGVAFNPLIDGYKPSTWTGVIYSNKSGSLNYTAGVNTPDLRSVMYDASRNELYLTNVSLIPNIFGSDGEYSQGGFTINSGVNRLILNFSSANGFLKYIDNVPYNIFATIEVSLRYADSTVVRHDLQYSSNEGNVALGVYRTFEIVNTRPNESFTISVSRVTNRDKRSNVSNLDKIEWTGIYTFEALPSNHSFGDVTLAHVLIPNNSFSNLAKERKFNLTCTRLLNGVTASRNAFEVAEAMAIDPYIGRLTRDQIYLTGLSGQVTTYFNDGDAVNFGYVFDNRQFSFQDSFKLIMDAVNCRAYSQGGVYTAHFERRQDISTRQITQRNKIPDTEERTELYDMSYDGVELTYRDNATGLHETITIGDGFNLKQIDLHGVVDYNMAYRRAMREYNKQQYEYLTVSFEVDDFGRSIVPYSRIDSPDSTRFTLREGVDDGYRVYDGEVMEVRGLTLELSQPVSFVDGENHFITFTKSDGTNSDPILVTQGNNEFTVVLNNLPDEPIYDGYMKDKTKYTFTSEQLRESIAYLPVSIESTDGNYKIECVNYSHDFYKNDLD